MGEEQAETKLHQTQNDFRCRNGAETVQFFTEALVSRKQKTSLPVKIGKKPVWKWTGNGLVLVGPAGGGWWRALAEISQMKNGIEMVKKRCSFLRRRVLGAARPDTETLAFRILPLILG